MDTGQLILLSERLVLGTASSILAILIWSRSRDAAWMFIVLAVLANYLNVLYNLFLSFGIVSNTRIGSLPVLTIVFDALPYTFFIISFLIVMIRKFK